MLKWNGKKVSEQIEKQNRIGVKKACMLLEREIKQSMKSTPRLTETKYKRQKGKKGIYHHPSPPGSPPAVDTGRLIGSISHNFSWEGIGRGVTTGQAKPEDGVSQPTAGKNESVGVTGTAVEYAPYLEFGTPNKKVGKMEARPFLREALIKNQDKIAGMFK